MLVIFQVVVAFFGVKALIFYNANALQKILAMTP